MISLQNIRFEYDHTPVLEKISFTIGPGDRIGLIGPNGAGKSTLLKLIAGSLSANDGNIDRTRDIIGLMPQELTPWRTLTAREAIEELTGVTGAFKDLEMATENMMEDEGAYSAALEKIESLGAYSLGERLPRALREVGLAPDLLDHVVGDLSGGQQTKLALAAILAAQYDAFLLDEPTNNLDLAGIELLQKFIKDSKAGFLIISHDRKFLKDVMNKIVVLKDRAGGMESFGGGFADWRLQLERERAAKDRAQRIAELERGRLEQALDRKTAASVTSDRNDRGKRDNDKMASDQKSQNAGKTLARQAKALETRLDRLDDVETIEDDLDLTVLFPLTKNQPGGDMATLKGIVVNYGNKQLGPYDLVVRGGDRLAIVGPNGQGKSTLVKVLAGEIGSSSGERDIAEATKIGFIAQQPEFSNPDDSLVDNVARLAGADQTKAATELARFGIPREVQLVAAVRVSPGQRGKAFLAVHALRATNLLIMDEPTNHLEVAATEALGKALASYPGALVVVSHDREFLQEVGIKRFVVVEEGKVLPEKAGEAYKAHFTPEEEKDQ